ncbi:MAG: DUF4922 domain-containing protein [Muribaculaceae bacterium]|nr:DUF4922 domain-containing protein [Muribaculaceae bacterium]
MAKKKTSPDEQPAHLAMYREVVKLFDQQMNWWDLARRNHLALDNMERRTLYLFQGDGSSLKFQLQYNPERRRSAAAPTTEGPAEPPCFLCQENQPPEQMSVGWKSRWNEYRLQLNPYPILHNHITIADMRHLPQSLNSGRLEDMVELSVLLPGWVVFFNGARCGASAPHHFHFQAGLPDVPLCKEMARYAKTLPTHHLIHHDGEKFVGTIDTAGRFAIVGSAPRPIDVFQFLDSAFLAIAETTGDDDPPVNAIAWCEKQRGYFALFPRRRHRPSCYGTGEGQHLVSPATLEMAGVWPVARKEDFDALTATTLRGIYRELCVDADTAAAIVSRLKSIL